MSQLKFINSSRGKVGIILQNDFYTERKALKSCEIICMCLKKIAMSQ